MQFTIKYKLLQWDSIECLYEDELSGLYCVFVIALVIVPGIPVSTPALVPVLPFLMNRPSCSP